MNIDQIQEQNPLTEEEARAIIVAVSDAIISAARGKADLPKALYAMQQRRRELLTPTETQVISE